MPRRLAAPMMGPMSPKPYWPGFDSKDAPFDLLLHPSKAQISGAVHGELDIGLADVDQVGLDAIAKAAAAGGGRGRDQGGGRRRRDTGRSDHRRRGRRRRGRQLIFGDLGDLVRGTGGLGQPGIEPGRFVLAVQLHQIPLIIWAAAQDFGGCASPCRGHHAIGRAGSAAHVHVLGLHHGHGHRGGGRGLWRGGEDGGIDLGQGLHAVCIARQGHQPSREPNRLVNLLKLDQIANCPPSSVARTCPDWPATTWSTTGKSVPGPWRAFMPSILTTATATGVGTAVGSITASGSGSAVGSGAGSGVESRVESAVGGSTVGCPWIRYGCFDGFNGASTGVASSAGSSVGSPVGFRSGFGPGASVGSTVGSTVDAASGTVAWVGSGHSGWLGDCLCGRSRGSGGGDGGDSVGIGFHTDRPQPIPADKGATADQPNGQGDQGADEKNSQKYGPLRAIWTIGAD